MYVCMYAIDKWLEGHNLDLNIKKTNIVSFACSVRSLQAITFSYCGDQFTSKEKVVFLGQVLTLS